jgi:hypothetical protein
MNFALLIVPAHRLFSYSQQRPSASTSSYTAPSLVLRLPHHIPVTRSVNSTLLQCRKRTLRARLRAVGVQYAPYPRTITYNKKTPASTSFHGLALAYNGHFTYRLALANCARLSEETRCCSEAELSFQPYHSFTVLYTGRPADRGAELVTSLPFPRRFRQCEREVETDLPVLGAAHPCLAQVA